MTLTQRAGSHVNWSARQVLSVLRVILKTNASSKNLRPMEDISPHPHPHTCNRILWNQSFAWEPYQIFDWRWSSYVQKKLAPQSLTKYIHFSQMQIDGHSCRWPSMAISFLTHKCYGELQVGTPMLNRMRFRLCTPHARWPSSKVSGFAKRFVDDRLLPQRWFIKGQAG